MTKANVLRKLFKKLFDVDLEGNSTTTILSDALSKDISVGGGGSGGSCLVINYVRTEQDPWGRCDKTGLEIYEACSAGIPCMIIDTDGNTTDCYQVTSVSKYEYNGTGDISIMAGGAAYSTANLDGYPTMAD